MLSKPRSDARWQLLGWLWVLMAQVGCAADTSASGTFADDGTPLALGVGDHGAQVAELHEQLKAFGYLPNDALKEQFPTWRPVVVAEPADWQTFDETTATALMEFQRKHKLDTTGVLDDQTRAAMTQRSCGSPDSAPIDPSEKFAYLQGKWKKNPLTWKFMNTPRTARYPSGGPSIPSSTKNRLSNTVSNEIRTAVRNAAAAWNREIYVQIQETTGTPDIEVWFEELTELRNVNVVAAAAPTRIDGSGTITKGIVKIDVLDTDFLGRPSKPVVYGSWMTNFIAHEIGHVLGLGHSSVGPCVPGTPGRCTGGGPPLMSPTLTGSARVDFTEDDLTASGALYDIFVVRNDGGCARDIAIGGTGAVLAVGCDGDANGHFIYRKEQFNWQRLNGNGERIAVNPDGTPWVVNQNNQLLRGYYVSGGVWWNQEPGDAGCARDIAVGEKGAVWKIGCDVQQGGYGIHRRIESTSTWERVDGGAVAISVGKDGLPWAVNEDGNIYRLGYNDVWQKLDGLGTDIAVGPYNNAYVVGMDGHIYTYNEQLPATYAQAWETVSCTSDADCGGGVCQTGRCTDQPSAPGIWGHWVRYMVIGPGPKRIAVMKGSPLVVSESGGGIISAER